MHDKAERIRHFNRFYTQKIGVLEESLLHSAFTLTQVRVMFEIAHRQPAATAKAIAKDLSLDVGYLSRILTLFEDRHLITRERSAVDGRHHFLSLSKKGRGVFDSLNKRSEAGAGALLAPLSQEQQSLLLEAMRSIERLIGPETSRAQVRLRKPRPGDFGWVVAQHGKMYACEYGWDNRFEALVARIVADFVSSFDASKERCWVADSDGDNAGCVFVAKKSASVAQLRLLLVDPRYRKAGIGRSLVSAAIEFARSAGYRKMVLWTNSVLVAARRIYESHGFMLAEEERHDSFGKKLTGQTWELTL